MEPQIQYATTKDGVRIAFATVGEGPPLVWVNQPLVSHAQLQWRHPTAVAILSSAMAARTIVSFDVRGTGLSEREVDDLSVEPWVRDLEAVVDRLEFPLFSLAGIETGAAIAITYAVRHPERVSHLILLNPFVRLADVFAMPQIEAMIETASRDWEMLTESIAGLGYGYRREDVRQFGDLIAASITPEVFSRVMATWANVDLSGLLARVKTETLVVHHTGVKYVTMDMARDVVAGIPNARMHIVQGAYADDVEHLAQAIDEFLGESEEKVDEQQPALPSGTAIILFLDIADSTALTTKLGDAAYREKERALDASLRAAITGAGGTAVEGKVLGDGVMAVFTSARSAIEAAQRCRDLGNDAGLPLHLGIHAGDVVREGNNVHGGAVQVASRVQGAAVPGEILVSATVRDLARTSAGVTFEDRGEHELKGIAEPQRLFAVRAAGSPSAGSPSAGSP